MQHPSELRVSRVTHPFNPENELQVVEDFQDLGTPHSSSHAAQIHIDTALPSYKAQSPTAPSTYTPTTRWRAPVGAGLRIETSSRDGINLVNEDDGRRILLCEPEHVTHHARTLQEGNTLELTP